MKASDYEDDDPGAYEDPAMYDDPDIYEALGPHPTPLQIRRYLLDRDAEVRGSDA